MSEDIKLTPKVANEVEQLIEGLPKFKRDRIPKKVLDTFKNLANEKDKYPVDTTKSLIDQKLDPLSIKIIGRILVDIPKAVEYVEKEPKWSEVKDKKEAIKIMESEICTNLFNVHNVLASRKLAKEKYVLDTEWYGRICDKENYELLEPFIVLCNIFSVCNKTYKEKNNVDETYDKYVFLCNEIRKNIDKL